MRVLRFSHNLIDDVTAIRLNQVLSKGVAPVLQRGLVFLLSERRLSEELAQGIPPLATVALDPLHDIVLALDSQCQPCGLRHQQHAQLTPNCLSQRIISLRSGVYESQNVWGHSLLFIRPHLSLLFGVTRRKRLAPKNG